MAFGDPLDPNNPLKLPRPLPPNASGAGAPVDTSLGAGPDLNTFNPGKLDPEHAFDPDGLILPGGMSAKTPPMDAVPGQDLPTGPPPPPTPPETAPTPKVDTPIGPMNLPTPQATQAAGGFGGYLKNLATKLPKALAIAQAGYGNDAPLRAIEGEEARQQQFNQQQFENTITKQREDRAQQLYSAQLANFQSELAYRQFQQKDAERKALQASTDRSLIQIAAKIPMKPDGSGPDLSQVTPEQAQNFEKMANGVFSDKYAAIAPGGGIFDTNSGAVTLQPSQKPETQEQNKQNFQNIVKTVAQAGFPTDAAHLTKSIDAAHAAGKINDSQYGDFQAYQAANPIPATNLAVHIEGGQALQNSGQQLKDAHTYYTYQDPRTGKTAVALGNDPKMQGVEAIPIGNQKDFAQYMSEANQSNIIQTSFNRLHQDITQHPEIFDNAAARGILATSLESIDRAHAGILVAGTGGSIPLPSGLNKMIDTALQNNALDKPTGDAVKQYIADYRSAKDKAIAMQMEMQNGKIGRGAAQAFDAIYQQFPNGGTADSVTAKRLMDNLQITQNQLANKYPEQFGSFTKIPSYNANSPVNPPAAFGNTGRPLPTSTASTGGPTVQQPRSRQLSRAQFHANYPGVPDSELEKFALANKAQIID